MNALLLRWPPWLRHAVDTRDKTHLEAGMKRTPGSQDAMAELAQKIIRQQWPLRHHPDPARRAQARSLIRAHTLMLRQWRTQDLLPA